LRNENKGKGDRLENYDSCKAREAVEQCITRLAKPKGAKDERYIPVCGGGYGERVGIGYTQVIKDPLARAQVPPEPSDFHGCEKGKECE
jgi:hypothetical protein